MSVASRPLCSRRSAGKTVERVKRLEIKVEVVYMLGESSNPR
jgi:hypothetical protein